MGGTGRRGREVTVSGWQVGQESGVGVVLLKKKLLMTLVKNGKADSIQGHCDGRRDHCNGIL